MDNPFENLLSSVAAQLLSALWPLIPAIIAVMLLKTAWFKGVYGELIINLALRFQLNQKEYRPLKDLTLPTPDGTTQIDHLIVSRFGVFVIETKNMKGWIFGGERQAQWTQKIYRRSYKFQNPLRQNYKHVKTVQELLGIPEEKIHNVVVFIGDAKIKTGMPANVVYGGRGLTNYIKSKKQAAFDTGQMDDMVKRLTESRLEAGMKTNRAHIRHLKEARHTGRQMGTATGKNAQRNITTQCPSCGSRMVARIKRRSGERFLGCSRFPKCRGVRALPQSG